MGLYSLNIRQAIIKQTVSVRGAMFSTRQEGILVCNMQCNLILFPIFQFIFGNFNSNQEVLTVYGVVKGDEGANI